MFRFEKTVYFPLSWILKRNWFGILRQIFQKESSVDFACRLKRFSQETVIFWIKIFCILFLKDTRIESTFWWKKLGRIAETEIFGARRIFFGKSFFLEKIFFSYHLRTLMEKMRFADKPFGSGLLKVSTVRFQTNDFGGSAFFQNNYSFPSFQDLERKKVQTVEKSCSAKLLKVHSTCSQEFFQRNNFLAENL